MDPGAWTAEVNRRTEAWSGAWRLAFLLAAGLLFFEAGCYRAARGVKKEAAPATAESSVPSPSPAEPDKPREDVPPPVSTVSVPEAATEKSQGDPTPGSATPPAVEPSPEKETAPAVPLPEREKAAREPGPPEGKTVASIPKPSPDPRGKADGKAKPAGTPKTPPGTSDSPADENRAQVVIARLSEDMAFSQDGPSWARRKEELVYKVEFLGITMGYARFSFQGKVILSGKEAYHLRVRAWTSDLLAIIYPVDETIDYYLDVQTLVPLRQEHTRSRKEDVVAIYDQEKGTILYRYLETGKVRKKVDVVPNVYDPVSIAYYYRSRELKDEEKGQAMYAGGGKVWEVSAKPLGFERIRTDQGEFDTVIIRPVFRREGKVEDKGDLKMWMTRDERHVPVRVYAKFKKIRTWTLVGELLPDQQGG